MRYVLHSSSMVAAPGFIAWAQNGAAFQKDRKRMAQIVSVSWAIPYDAAMALVTKAVPFKVIGEKVVFEHGD